MKEIKKRIESPKGYCGYRITDENVEITDIFVQPKFRGEGVGKDMVEKVVNDSGGKACVYLFTRHSNRQAQGFYEAIGFERVCDIDGFYRSEPGVMYIKKL